MHPNLIDAFYRFVASGSTSEPEIFWQGRNGPLFGKQVLEWSTVQTSLTATGQRLAIWGDWSGFTIVDRLGAQIELIPHLLGATNRFPTGQCGILYIWRSSSGVTKPNALRLICSELLLDHLRVPTGYPSAHIGGYWGLLTFPVPHLVGKLDGPRSSQRVSRSEVAGKHRILEESSTAGPSWEAFESQLGGVPDQTATE